MFTSSVFRNRIRPRVREKLCSRWSGGGAVFRARHLACYKRDRATPIAVLTGGAGRNDVARRNPKRHLSGTSGARIAEKRDEGGAARYQTALCFVYRVIRGRDGLGGIGAVPGC